MVKKKSANKKSANNIICAKDGGGGGDGIMVDPIRVRFQHSRIRPVFSGCGRRVENTLDDIRQGKLQPSDLPPIQVLLGPLEEETGQPWYFSLNNRRLWVFKRCREEGLLPNNQVYVRVRKPKSEQEACRYTVENCALEAKIISEKPKGRAKGVSQISESEATDIPGLEETNTLGCLPQTAEKQHSIMPSVLDNGTLEAGDESQDSESSDEEPAGPFNRFSALF